MPTKKDPKVDIIEKIEHHILHVLTIRQSLPNKVQTLELIKKFIAKLDGFTFRKGAYSWSATRNGVKFSFEYDRGWSGFFDGITAITSKGGWSCKVYQGKENQIQCLRYEFKREDWNLIPNLDDIVCYMVEIADAYNYPEVKKLKPVLSKDELPEPLTFSESVGILAAHESVHDVKPWARKITSVIAMCEVINVVGINGTAFPDASILSKPDEDSWFLLDCRNAVAASFNIISDGEVFHPVDRYNMYKITRKLNPKKSVDLSKMCATDKKIVVKSIEKFVSKI